MYKPRGNWMTALRRLERRPGWEKTVLAYEYWIAAPVKRKYSQVAIFAGHNPKLHRKTLYTHGKRLIQKLLDAGFPSREVYQKTIAGPSRKRWGAEKMKGLDRVIVVRGFLYSLDAEGFDVLLDEIREKGYTVAGGPKSTSGEGEAEDLKSGQPEPV